MTRPSARDYSPDLFFYSLSVQQFPSLVYFAVPLISLKQLEHYQSTHPSMQQKKISYYRCKNCNLKLFDTPLHGQQCSSYFIDVQPWLPQPEENEVKLKCPKCAIKIGEVIWSGKKCNCMKWITPAIQVHRQKVDHIKPLGL